MLWSYQPHIQAKDKQPDPPLKISVRHRSSEKEETICLNVLALLSCLQSIRD